MMRWMPSSGWGRVLLGLGVVVLGIQLVPRGPRNISSVQAGNRLQDRYAVPDSVMTVLQLACYDCHSNHTVYPWYSQVQPVAWWMDEHVRQGREELNFDEFGTYPLKRQQHKFESIAGQVEQRDMPLVSYTWMHRGARLSVAERQRIVGWANACKEKGR